MDLKTLNDEFKKIGAKTTVISFSDLGDFDNWDAEFWIGLEDTINEFKTLGKDKVIDKIVDISIKIGEKNYNSLKNAVTLSKFNVPIYDVVTDKSKLKQSSTTNGKLIILLDLITTKVSERRKKLEKDLVELQKELDKLI